MFINLLFMGQLLSNHWIINCINLSDWGQQAAKGTTAKPQTLTCNDLVLTHAAPDLALRSPPKTL